MRSMRLAVAGTAVVGSTRCSGLSGNSRNTNAEVCGLVSTTTCSPSSLLAAAVVLPTGGASHSSSLGQQVRYQGQWVDKATRAALDEVYNMACVHGVQNPAQGGMPVQQVLLKATAGSKAVIFKSGLGIKKWVANYPTYFKCFELKGQTMLAGVNAAEYIAEQRLKVDSQNALSNKDYQANVKSFERYVNEKQTERIANRAEVSTSRPWEITVERDSTRAEKKNTNHIPQYYLKKIRKKVLFDPEELLNREQTEEKMKADGTWVETLVPTQIDETDEAFSLLTACYKLIQLGHWESMEHVYNCIYRSEEARNAVPRQDFTTYISSKKDFFWIGPHGLFCHKCDGQEEAPLICKEDYQTACNKNKKRKLSNLYASGAIPLVPGHGTRLLVADKNTPNEAPPEEEGADEEEVKTVVKDPMGPLPEREFGGWGSRGNIPNSEQIYEILKYVPVDWGTMSALNIGKEVKKRCIRIHSPLEWFRRQPQYFEVRNREGTLEIRRSVVLHPDSHGLTKEEAKKIVEEKIKELNAMMKKHTATLNVENQPVPTPSDAPANRKEAAAGQQWRGGIPTAGQIESWLKLLSRVVPSYFIPAEQIVRRAPKRGHFSAKDLCDCARNHPSLFDVMVLSNRQELVRRKSGVEASKWGHLLQGELERACKGRTCRHVMDLMARSSVLWDRTHFLYVRLSEREKNHVKDFDGMIATMKQYPSIWKVGEYFFRRVDHSDPARDDADMEPIHSLNANATRMVYENPYHVREEMADVLHYLTPEDEPATITHYMDCCSPAMRSVIPHRLVTLLQDFPLLFTCKEVTPGFWHITKKPKPVAVDDTVVLPQPKLIKHVDTVRDEGDSPFDEEKEQEYIAAIVKAVPTKGVLLEELGTLVKVDVREALIEAFTSLEKFIERHPSRVQIVRDDLKGVMVYNNV